MKRDKTEYTVALASRIIRINLEFGNNSDKYSEYCVTVGSFAHKTDAFLLCLTRISIIYERRALFNIEEVMPACSNLTSSEEYLK
jgi:hypothetical protein